VIATVLMIFVVLILALALAIARTGRQHEARLERDNRTMLSELDRHRQTVESILRELRNP